MTSCAILNPFVIFKEFRISETKFYLQYLS